MTSFIQQAHETGHFDYYTKIPRLTYTSYISEDKNAIKDDLRIQRRLGMVKHLPGIYKALGSTSRTTTTTKICLIKLANTYCQAWLMELWIKYRNKSQWSEDSTKCYRGSFKVCPKYSMLPRSWYSKCQKQIFMISLHWGKIALVLRIPPFLNFHRRFCTVVEGKFNFSTRHKMQ